MMTTLIPKEAIRCDLEQNKAEQRAMQKVDWLRQIGLHPSLCSRLRIQFCADIQ
jgi:hypothetical protein